MKTLIRDIFSRPIFQNFFEGIIVFTLKVLNIGEGQAVETSGEKNVVTLLDKISNDKEVVVFDVGAHTGEWFGIFKSIYTKKAKIYSFEPEKKAFLELSKINDAELKPVNLALGDTVEKKYLSGAQVIDNTTNSDSEEINVTTIDKYCSDNNIKYIDLLKMDVEGYELRILRGAKEMIKNGNIKLIQFEFGAVSSEKYSMQDFFDILGEKYTICRILKHGYYPLKKYKHYYEILSLTNFIAIKK
jgi:FkbM family methyltransferase